MRGALPPATHRQPLFPLKPIELLVVEPDALASQQQTELAVAEPPALRRQFLQLGPQGIVIRMPGPIAIGLQMQADARTG